MEFLGFLAGGWAIVWTVVLFGIIVATTENELGWVSFIVLAIGVTVMELAGASALWPWVVENPLRLVVYLVGYLIAGGLWSLFKWWLFVRRRMPEVKEAFQRWSRDHASAPMDEFIASSYHNPVSLSDNTNQERIMRWMIWWVPSLFWTLLSDLLISIWNRVYDLMAGGYRAIMRRIVLGVIGK